LTHHSSKEEGFMPKFRKRCAQVCTAGAAVFLSLAGLSVISALPANAAPLPVPVQQNFSFAGPTGFAQLSTTGAAGSPVSAPQGSNFQILLPGGSQAVPTSQSGVAVNFISGVTQFYEIPAGSAFVNVVASGQITWTGGTNPSLPPSGSATLTMIDCTTAGQTGCTAHSNAPLTATGGVFGGFDGPNPTFPYLEISTGSTQIPAGATLTTPNVTVTLTASGAVGTVLNWSQFEFDTSANITLFGASVNAVINAWPSKLLFAPTTVPPCNGLTASGTPPSCPNVTVVPLNAVNAAGNGAGTLDSGLEFGPPPVLTSTTIGAPAPFINVTNPAPINSTAAGVTINVSGANWPVSATGTLAWSGCPTPALCNDTGTFTTSTTGALTGTILFGPNEQLPTSQSAITVTLTATSGTTTTNTQVTVNPFQAFSQMCSIGVAPNSTCTVNQTISAQVIGTALTISEVMTAPNTSNSAVTLSPVTLGVGANPAQNNTQFDQANGMLNSLVVDDNRGTLGGWSVTGQLGGDFNNATPVGPALDNVIPADFLTWLPAVALATPGSLPANNANTPGCPDQTPAPTGHPVCTGPSGLPSSTGAAGGLGVNGTGAGVTGATEPAEVTAGNPAVLHNPAGALDELCATATGSHPGGGGGFVCSAGLSLAVPPYVAAGTYSATMNLVVIGF
jgi:hypothetical protein